MACAACALDTRSVTTKEAANAAQGGAGAAAIAGAAGNGEMVSGSMSAGGASGAPDASATPASPPTKLDLLFMVDNSVSMSDKQAILLLAIPDLMSRLVSPICIDDAGNELPAPAAGVDCPAGQRRQFEPIDDIHVGIISSSLGDWGADVACPVPDSAGLDRADLGHLIGSLPRGQVTGANPRGFLEWTASTELDLFTTAFQVMLSAVGERGCGWEASLEAWYRFLVDPAPYRRLVHVPCDGEGVAEDCVAPSVDASGRIELDDVLLAQRAAFLRPDSLVAIVMLTDENDCSMVPGGTNWIVTAVGRSEPMFRGTSECDTNPNDRCCRSCVDPTPEGCANDPSCDDVPPDSGQLPDRLAFGDDGINLRCFDQKRRFGRDYLYPTERYVRALSERELCLERPDLDASDCTSAPVPNPLFAGGRSPESVILAGIVGVPWQAIAAGADERGRPIQQPERQLRFKSSSELTDADWLRIAGSPGSAAAPPTAPGEPTMAESTSPRPGVVAGNPINGRDYDTAQGFGAPNDLEYACTFSLLEPRDCALRDINAGEPCDCYAGENDRPLCEATPGNGSAGTTQFWAKAYPGLRQLEVLRGMGENGIVASICARNVRDAARPDFGYRPAVAALIERLQRELD